MERKGKRAPEVISLQVAQVRCVGSSPGFSASGWQCSVAVCQEKGRQHLRVLKMSSEALILGLCHFLFSSLIKGS